MLILRSSPASPFGRKVKIVAYDLGLMDRIEVTTADTNDPHEPLREQNPLGKIPTLILENGETLFDSRVIVEYLDHLAGGGRVIPHGETRFQVLRMAALADGIMEAALLQIYEARFRDEAMHSAKWLAHHAEKVSRGLAALEAAPPALHAMLDVGAIGVACALGYLDLRFNGAWRATHPNLVAWLHSFETRCPAYAKTRMPA